MSVAAPVWVAGSSNDISVCVTRTKWLPGCHSARQRYKATESFCFDWDVRGGKHENDQNKYLVTPNFRQLGPNLCGF